MNNYFNQRKTCRKFKPEAISLDSIKEMLSDAACAPTTGGMQLYSIIITQKPENRKRLAELHFNQPASQAPLLITFAADFNRFSKWCEQRKAKPGYDNFQSFISAMLDTTIVAQQFNTIAEQKGLGCCYLGTTTYNAPQIAELLKLPHRVVPIVTIAVGLPDDDSIKAERLDANSFIHEEVYCDYTIEDINGIYAGKEALPINRKFVTDNNKETLAQVFTDIRYPQSSNEEFSRIFYKFIEQQGFEFQP